METCRDTRSVRWIKFGDTNAESLLPASAREQAPVTVRSWSASAAATSAIEIAKGQRPTAASVFWSLRVVFLTKNAGTTILVGIGYARVLVGIGYARVVLIEVESS